MLSDFIAGHSSLQNVLPTLSDAALKGAILVVIAALAVYLLRNRSAASRHAVWTAAVVGHLAIVALVFVLPAWTLPILPAAPWLQVVNSSAGPAGASAIKGAVPPGAVTNAALTTKSPQPVSPTAAPGSQ